MIKNSVSNQEILMANTGIENAEKIVKLTEEREAQTQKIKDL